MPKIKLRIDRRHDVRDVVGKIYVDEYKGTGVGDLDGEAMSEDYAEAMEAADWSDDAGTGRAILLPDGRELLSPLSVAPPSSIAAAAAEPSVNDLVNRALARHFEQLKADDEIDSLEDHDDFGEDEDFTPFSQFEVVLRDEAPAIPAEPVSDEAVADVLEAEEVLPKPKKVKAPAKEPDEPDAAP